MTAQEPKWLKVMGREKRDTLYENERKKVTGNR